MNTKVVITIITFILTISNTMAQNKNEETLVKAAITTFAKAADTQDDKTLEEVLDNSFRLSMNQLFGGTELVSIDKQTYIQKIRLKEFGGDKREVTIEHITIVKNNAQVQVTFKGSKMTIVTLIQLVKNKDGVWKVLNDIPSIL
jgi:Putative lumazine-binding